MVLSTAAWAVFLTAQEVLSGRWWPWLLVDLIPPISYVLAPLALVVGNLVLVWRRRGGSGGAVGVVLWVVAVLVLLAGLPRSGLNMAALNTREEAGAVAPTIRVVSWNTDLWHRDDDPDAFYRFLREQNADIYLLQEYLDWNDAVPDAGALPMFDEPRLRAEFPGFAVVARGELVTVSRFPVLATPHVAPDRPDLGPDFTDIYEGAKVLRTDLDVRGRAVSVYNVHIAVQLSIARDPWRASFYDYVERRHDQRSAQFQGLAADVAANSAPAVIAGDLNTTAAMADIDTLTDVASDAITANRDLYPASWSTAPGRGWWRLDWAFSTTGVEVDDYDFVETRLSDHSAQVLEISIEGDS